MKPVSNFSFLAVTRIGWPAVLGAAGSMAAVTLA
jgi:hypothetical protein